MEDNKKQKKKTREMFVFTKPLREMRAQIIKHEINTLK